LSRGQAGEFFEVVMEFAMVGKTNEMRDFADRQAASQEQ